MRGVEVDTKAGLQVRAQKPQSPLGGGERVSTWGSGRLQPCLSNYKEALAVGRGGEGGFSSGGFASGGQSGSFFECCVRDLSIRRNDFLKSSKFNNN